MGWFFLKSFPRTLQNVLYDLPPLLPSKTSFRHQCRCQELDETPKKLHDFCLICVGAQHAIAVLTDNPSCSTSAGMFPAMRRLWATVYVRKILFLNPSVTLDLLSYLSVALWLALVSHSRKVLGSVPLHLSLVWNGQFSPTLQDECSFNRRSRV